MLGVLLVKYDVNEGAWNWLDVQSDLLKAFTAISACLERGGLKMVR